MKVFFVDLALYKMGGVERVISTLANHMADKYHVEVCSLYKHHETPFYNYNKRVALHYLIDLSDAKSTRSKTKIAFFFYRILEKIYEQIFLNKKIKIFCNNYLMKSDVVVFGRTNTAILFLPYMENFKGKIIVRDASHLHNASLPVRKSMKKYFYDFVSTFIVSSEESKELYEDFFGQGMIKIKKMYNPLGIVPQKADSMKYKRIIGVGRYNYEKGFDNLILAFANVSHEHPDWKLSLIGSGEEYHHYVNMCRKLGISEKVEFKRSTNIVEEYCKSGIFVMTSHGEGYANALVEAMACGLPVISYNWYVGVDDIIKDRENGIIVHLHDREQYFKTKYSDDADIKNLAIAINELIQNTELRKKIAQNAVKIIESRDAQKIVAQWIKIIEEE